MARQPAPLLLEMFHAKRQKHLLRRPACGLRYQKCSCEKVRLKKSMESPPLFICIEKSAHISTVLWICGKPLHRCNKSYTTQTHEKRNIRVIQVTADNAICAFHASCVFMKRGGHITVSR